MCADVAVPESTLAILLGASSFPSSSLESSESFLNSATAFFNFLIARTQGFGLPESNILNLFNSEVPPTEIGAQISNFLNTRARIANDVIVYYVGHGGFTGINNDYYLALHSTTDDNRGISSLRMADLARSLVEGARHSRRYIILDSCFAASAYKEFMSAPLEAVRVKTLTEFPRKGTALLCSSGRRDPSKAPEGERYTMFSGALLNVLQHGSPIVSTSITLYELGRAIQQVVKDKYTDSAVRPEVHSPDQREGDVADFPLFPNLKSLTSRSAVAAGAQNEFLTGTSTVQIWISQLFRIVDLHIFPDSVRARKVLEVVNDNNKMRRVLNRHTKFRLGNLGSIKPVVAISEQFDGFWQVGVPDFVLPQLEMERAFLR